MRLRLFPANFLDHFPKLGEVLNQQGILLAFDDILSRQFAEHSSNRLAGGGDAARDIAVYRDGPDLGLRSEQWITRN